MGIGSLKPLTLACGVSAFAACDFRDEAPLQITALARTIAAQAKIAAAPDSPPEKEPHKSKNVYIVVDVSASFPFAARQEILSELQNLINALNSGTDFLHAYFLGLPADAQAPLDEFGREEQEIDGNAGAAVNDNAKRAVGETLRATYLRLKGTHSDCLWVLKKINKNAAQSGDEKQTVVIMTWDGEPDSVDDVDWRRSAYSAFAHLPPQKRIAQYQKMVLAEIRRLIAGGAVVYVRPPNGKSLPGYLKTSGIKVLHAKEFAELTAELKMRTPIAIPSESALPPGFALSLPEPAAQASVCPPCKSDAATVSASVSAPIQHPDKSSDQQRDFWIIILSLIAAINTILYSLSRIIDDRRRQRFSSDKEKLTDLTFRIREFLNSLISGTLQADVVLEQFEEKWRALEAKITTALTSADPKPQIGYFIKELESLAGFLEKSQPAVAHANTEIAVSFITYKRALAAGIEQLRAALAATARAPMSLADVPTVITAAPARPNRELSPPSPSPRQPETPAVPAAPVISAVTSGSVEISESQRFTEALATISKLIHQIESAGDMGHFKLIDTYAALARLPDELQQTEIAKLYFLFFQLLATVHAASSKSQLNYLFTAQDYIGFLEIIEEQNGFRPDANDYCARFFPDDVKDQPQAFYALHRYSGSKQKQFGGEWIALPNSIYALFGMPDASTQPPGIIAIEWNLSPGTTLKDTQVTAIQENDSRLIGGIKMYRVPSERVGEFLETAEHVGFTSEPMKNPFQPIKTIVDMVKAQRDTARGKR